MDYVIYHNPRCSKSRETLSLLQERGIEPVVVEYLKEPPTADQLRELLDLLGLEPRDLMRRHEPRYAELGLDAADISDDALIEAMVRNPILIERPIVVSANRAVIGRPPARVLELV